MHAPTQASKSSTLVNIRNCHSQTLPQTRIKKTDSPSPTIALALHTIDIADTNIRLVAAVEKNGFIKRRVKKSTEIKEG